MKLSAAFKSAAAAIMLLCMTNGFPYTAAGANLPASAPLDDFEITVDGARRTDEEYIRNLLSDCFKDDGIHTWEQIDPQFVEQCLLNSKLFARASAAIRKPVIEIALTERWTLLPIPYFYTSEDDTTAGLFLMESNLFGQGKKGGIGGSISSNGNSYFLYYYDPAVRFTDWTFSFRIGSKAMEPVLTHDDSDYYSYEKEAFSYGANIGRKVFLPGLWVALGASAAQTDYGQVDSYPVPEDYDFYGFKARVLYKDTDFKFYFNEGLHINLEYDRQFYRSDSQTKTQTWDLTIEWQQKLIGNNALQLQLQLQEISDATIGDALLVGRNKGFRGIDAQGLWINRAQSLSIDYQIPILTYGYGTWTVAPFIDLTLFDPAVELPADSFTAWGLGGYLYLQNIALPGVGLVTGYNNEFGGFFVSFSLGMQF